MKLRTLIKGPLLVNAGYGVHARQIFKALTSNPLFEVFAENINWGHCSFLTDDTEEKREIKKCIERRLIERHQNGGNNHPFDIFVHITIPNEFERQGKFNIGVTAGMETDRVSHVWVQKCNEMDLIIVPSEHSKKVLLDTTVEWENPQTKQRGQFKVDKPIAVCHEGFNPIFHKWTETSEHAQKFYDTLNIETPFNFLHVGQWGRGGFGEDRKNIALLVKWFIEAFRGRKDVGLVLKVNMAKNSVMDFTQVQGRLKEIKSNFKEEEVPPIYLIHANLTEHEMAALYNHPKIKATVSLTHGEGFGLPLLEAAACGLPVLATNWSGHLDFLKLGKFLPLDYELKEIPDVAVWENIMIKGSRWACVKEMDVKNRMQKIVASYSKPKEWADDLAKKLQQEYIINKVCQDFIETVTGSLNNNQPAAAKIDPKQHLESFIDTPENFNVIYTMPMSAGDVFISTAVIDGLVKHLPEDHKIYFATQPQYADILKNNTHIYKVIPWNETMVNLDLLESVFDLAMTPNVATQYTFSNWVRRGQGRLLAEEFANHCHVELGDYFIDTDYETLHELLPGVDIKTSYMTFHPGSGKGQWESRRYDDWQEVLNNIRSLYPELKIVQVGSADEPQYKGVDIDLRGKTNYQQLAAVIEDSKLHLSIDTFTMHLAASMKVPVVALFGCSYASSTGPWVKDKQTAKYILLQSERLSGCKDKACYKNRCAVNPNNPPINEIDPKQVVGACTAMLGRGYGNTYENFQSYPYQRLFGTISGYTTTYNAMNYPFEECIKSMLGFCNEVVVVDGASTDGTWEKLEALSAADARVKLYQYPFDWNEPGMDGLQKTRARALCESDFLWQMDCDEVVHEDDYEKIKLITKRFPGGHDILHLPVIELWGNEQTVTGRRHCWKWRMSKNNPDVMHGINKGARITNEKTGKTYARKGMSDGCEYVSVMTNEMLPHTGFYNDQIEIARVHIPERYAQGINEVFEHLPSVYHYSWCSIERKLEQLKKGGVWDKMWSLLYQEETQDRFPGVETPEQLKELAKKLYEQGGEDSDKVKYKFPLTRSNPAIMKDWLAKQALIKDE